MFLQASVILSTGGVCLSACWDATPWSGHPQEQTSPEQTSPLEQTPLLGADPPSRHPPRADPPREADSGIRYTSGRYASYWNAFLFEYVSPLVQILSFSCSYQQQFCIHAPPPYIIHTQPFGSWHPLLGNLWLRSLYSS